MADRTTMPTDEATDPAHETEDVPAADPPTEPRLGPGPGAGLPAHVPRSVSNLLWQARIGVGLAVLFAALALALFLQASGLRADAAARDAVEETGRAVALQITTYDGATIDQWIADTQTMATSSFADEVATLFDPELRDGLAANEVRSQGEITSSFVQEVDGDSATVFAVLRQTYSSINLPREVSDQLRMEIELTRVDGRWLASNVVALGPSTISPVAGETEAAPPAADGEGG